LFYLPRQQKATAFGRDVAPLGREVGATGFARGAPQSKLMPLYANHLLALGDASSFFVSDFAPEEFSYL